MIGEAEKDAPRMVVLAGPNGSGKSTVADGLKQANAFPKLYINADDIARVELGGIADPLERNLKAAQLAESRRRAALEEGQSFAFETVMSTPGKLAFLDEAKAKGFIVDLVFVTTEDAAVNQVRVENRVAKGGHSVPPEKVYERHARAMELLPAALLKADTGMVFDNSVDSRAPLLVAAKQDGKIEFAENAPEWAKTRLVEPIKAREASRAELTAAVKSAAPNATVVDADIGGRKTYSGCIVNQSKQHIMQRTAGTTDQFVLHDRSLCPARFFEVGKATAISYAFGVDGKHQSVKPKSSQKTHQGMKPRPS